MMLVLLFVDTASGSRENILSAIFIFCGGLKNERDTVV